METKMELTIEALKQRLIYIAETGEFIWRVGKRKVQAGDRAGCYSNGYIRIGLLGKVYPAHRLAWFYTYGVWPEIIDHIDGQPANNVLSNLRDVTITINAQNRAGWGKYPKGVYKDRTGRFRAMLFFHGKHISLGTFDTIEEADEVVKNARIKRDLIQRGIDMG